MSAINFQPDPKYKTKQYLIGITVTAFVLILGILLQVLIPLSPDATPLMVARILWPIIGGVLILYWVISIPLIILWFKNLDFFIEDERITIHKGILTKIQQNIPFKAVTDFQLHRSLYDRLLGIGSIRVQTAGQSYAPTGFEGSLVGLPQWESLLNELRTRVKENQLQFSTKTDTPSQMSGDEVRHEVLTELRAIRKLLEEK